MSKLTWLVDNRDPISTLTNKEIIVPCKKMGDAAGYPRTTGIKLDLCICTIPTVGFYRKHGEVSISLFITIY
jgi:hypothetical protein